MRKIIVGYDGSEPAARAVQMALSFAEKFGATLQLVYAVPLTTLPPEAIAAGALEIDKAHKESARRMLEERKRTHERPEVQVEVYVLEGGAVAQRIADHASDEKADLIVVGSQGKGAVSRVLAGSISTRLVHLAQQPVLVVR